MVEDIIQKHYQYSSLVHLPEAYKHLRPVAVISNTKTSLYRREDWVECIYKMYGKRNKSSPTIFVNGNMVARGDGVTPVITLKPYNSRVDTELVEANALNLLKQRYDYAITIVPHNSYEILSFSLMIRDIMERIRAWGGANRKQNKISKEKAKRVVYNGVIEWGDENNHIHAHILLQHYIDEDSIIKLVTRAKASCYIIKLRDNKAVEDKLKIVSYHSSRALQYSSIDDIYNSTFSSDLILGNNT